MYSTEYFLTHITSITDVRGRKQEGSGFMRDVVFTVRLNNGAGAALCRIAKECISSYGNVFEMTLTCDGFAMHIPSAHPFSLAACPEKAFKELCALINRGRKSRGLQKLQESPIQE